MITEWIEEPRPGFKLGRMIFDGSIRHECPIIQLGGGPGPILCIMSGIHINEASSIAAAVSLADHLDLETLKGTISIVPIVSTHNLFKYTPKPVMATVRCRTSLRRPGAQLPWSVAFLTITTLTFTPHGIRVCMEAGESRCDVEACWEKGQEKDARGKGIKPLTTISTYVCHQYCSLLTNF